MGNRFIPITPTIKQAILLTVPYPEILYGGAAGGGKSVGILASALQYVDSPNYRALCLRRTYADLNLPEALIPLSQQWLQGTGAQWNGKLNEWTFPSGATLTFGYLETEVDKYRYQGSAFQFIGFDELTQFTESQYRYLFSRLRRTEGVNVPLRMRAASNPGGVGHDWVKKRFIDGADESRSFVPARLEDNPHLDVAAYEHSLNQLDPITRQQLRYGDWDVVTDGLFKKSWLRYWRPHDMGLKLDTGDIIKFDDCQTFATIDCAGVEKRPNLDPDYSVCQVWALHNGNLILLDQWREQAQTPDTEDAIARMIHKHGLDVTLCEHAHVGIGIIQHLKRRGFAIRPLTAKGSKVVRSQCAQIRMEAKTMFFPAHLPWMANEVEPELLMFPNGAHDDQVDALSYAAIHAQRTAGGLLEQQDKQTMQKQVDGYEAIERELVTAERRAQREVLDEDGLGPEWR